MFALCLASNTGDTVSKLTSEQRTALFTGNRVLSKHVGRLCLEQIKKMESQWASDKNLNASHHASVSASVKEFLARPEVARFVHCTDDQLSDFFARVIIQCEGWTSPADRLLGQKKGDRPLAMVQLLYDGPEVDEADQAPPKLISKQSEKLCDYLENTFKQVVGANPTNTNVNIAANPPVQGDMLSWVWDMLSWVWDMIIYCPSICMWWFLALASCAVWDNNLMVPCAMTYTSNFHLQQSTDHYLIICRTGFLAWSSIIWRKYYNRDKSIDKRRPYIYMLALIFMNASLQIADTMPLLRCGRYSTSNILEPLILPHWVWVLVTLYIGECIYLFLNYLYYVQDTEQRRCAKHYPHFAQLCAYSISLFQITEEFERVAYLKYFIFTFVCVSFFHTFSSIHKTMELNSTSRASRMAVRGTCLVFVLCNLGVIQIVPSDDIQLWRMMTKAVGRAHLEVFFQLLVFWIINLICPDPF